MKLWGLISGRKETDLLSGEMLQLRSSHYQHAPSELLPVSGPVLSLAGVQDQNPEFWMRRHGVC